MHTRKLTLKAALLSAAIVAAAAPALAAELTGQYIDDATITTKVKAAIIGDSNLKGSDISVETDKASVRLTGLVELKTQETEAVRVANQVNGVKSVQDHVTVRGTQEQ